MPILKSFLKDGEAESYQNVVVTFVPGRKAVMTIYESDDGDEEASGGGGEESWVEREQIVLSDYKTKEEMHALMVEKGFQLKSPEEIEAIQNHYKDEAEAKRIKAEERREEIRIQKDEMKRQREEERMREEEEAAAVDEGGDDSSSSDDSEDDEADSGAKDEL
mmetsp:Transcript_3139/g.4827  ORF Transcript_3139/g.4827 Transcript_3139/m.4827 type:complete len:163 (-) Transcript_3139:243-731(-)